MSPLLLVLAACGLDRNNGKDAASGEDPDGPGGVNGIGCDPDLELFTERVWEPILSRDCIVCHGPGGIGSEGSNLKLDPADLQASMEVTYPLGARLLEKPTGASSEGHGGGTIVAEGSEAYEALSFWVGWITGTCDVPEPVSCEQKDNDRLLRRLTHTEYARTIQDLVGVDIDVSSFASDPVVDGYRNDAAALVVSDLLADQYRSAAEAISAEVNLSQLLPCTTGDAACASTFIEDFGYRAFRRPLSQSDIDRYMGLWAEVAAEEGFGEGIRWVVAAMLQSPHLLYRSELGIQGESGRFTLTGWEIATALSYTLWGTTPDEELMADAASGRLDTASGIGEVAERMMADPRTIESAADMVEAWLDLGQLDVVSREGLTPSIRAAMKQETRDLVTDLASSGGTLADLMSARHTFVDSELSQLYGLSGTGRVELDGVKYGGLLTQGSVLTTHGHPLGSGPVQRGVLLRERMLCEDLPPPPSNLDVSPPPVDPTASTRDRYAEHSSNEICASCHEKIDPIGFGFEHYDHLGRWRETDEGHTIDASGHVDGVVFEGPMELATTLLDDERFRKCFVKTWKRYATGVESCGEDLGSEVGLLEPLARLPLSPAFLERAGGPDEGDTLAVGTRIDPEDPGEVDVPEGDLTLTLTVQNDWGAGYCADGSVYNGSTESKTWEVRSSPDGTINNIWDAVYRDDGGEWVFSGASYNAELAPGATVTFGFCANR